VRLLAIDFPPPEFIIFAVAVLLGVIGKLVDFARKMRARSIEAEERGQRQFGADLGEVAEPPPPPRLDLVRRLPRERRPEAAPVPAPPPPAPLPPPPRPHAEHEIVRMFRAPRGARNAVVLAEVLGRPKALRGR
jgi:hypothetical protein